MKSTLRHAARGRRAVAGTALGVAVATGALASQLLGWSAASAGTEHSIVTANSPSTGQPITGGGSWIVNKPSGYYVGRAVVGSSFDDEVTTGANWHYGRAVDGVDMCGWVLPGSLGATVGSPPDSCSTDTESSIAHRLTVGRDFNAAAHAATDGTQVAADPFCQLYLNYFHGSDFSSNGGHWANPAGAAASTVGYRFTTRDGAAAVVRDPVAGWAFVPVGCVQRPSPLYNDND